MCKYVDLLTYLTFTYINKYVYFSVTMQKRLSSLGSALATRSLSVFLHHMDNEGKFSSKLFFEYKLQFENHVVFF
jgi:hypothetical protein